MKKITAIALSACLFFCLEIKAQIAPIKPQKVKKADFENFHYIFEDSEVEKILNKIEPDTNTRRNLIKNVNSFYRAELKKMRKINFYQQDTLISTYKARIKSNKLPENPSRLLESNDSIKDAVLLLFDSLNHIPQKYTAINDSIRRNYRHTLKRNQTVCFFPAIDHYSASQFFGTQNLDSSSVSGNNELLFVQQSLFNYNNSSNTLALFQELYADYIGPVRLGFGIALTNPQNTADSAERQQLLEEKSYSKLVTGGGNFTLTASFPLLRINTNDKILQFYSLASPRLSIDAPATDSSSSVFAHHTTITWDNQLFLSSANSIFGLSLGFGLNYIAGNSTFNNSLGLQNSARKGFSLGMYSAGVTFSKSFTLRYTGYFGTKSVTDQLKGNLTISFVPGNIAQ